MRVELNLRRRRMISIDGPVEYLGAVMGQRQQLFAIQYPARVLRQRQQQAIFSVSGSPAAAGYTVHSAWYPAASR